MKEKEGEIPVVSISLPSKTRTLDFSSPSVRVFPLCRRSVEPCWHGQSSKPKEKSMDSPASPKEQDDHSVSASFLTAALRSISPGLAGRSCREALGGRRRLFGGPPAGSCLSQDCKHMRCSSDFSHCQALKLRAIILSDHQCPQKTAPGRTKPPQHLHLLGISQVDPAKCRFEANSARPWVGTV